MKLSKILPSAATCLLALALTAPSFAASPVPTASVSVSATPQQPSPAANPVLANMITLGAKLYYMGNQLGLDGWFIVKDGQIQVAYAPPGNQGVIIGAMFGNSGEDLSAAQVEALATTNPDVGALLNNSAAQQQGLLPSQIPTTVKSMPVVPLAPGDRLYQELSHAAGVTLGAAGSPLILMMMDPNCLHCRETWKDLRAAVASGGVRVRLIPVTVPETDDEREAAQLLRAADPLAAWNKYVDGDRTQLAGAPDAAQLTGLRANDQLASEWKMHTTPTLVYRGKDGKVKILQGAPDKIAPVLADLAP